MKSIPLIEQYGVDSIPEQERTSSPYDMVAILIGSNLCFGVVIFGWLPVSYGLDFWASVTSLIIGTVVGAVLTAPLALVSFRSATNLSTSSGAAFGVRGRFIGSFIGLLLSLGYTALTIWTGGDILIEALGRLAHLPKNHFVYSAAYSLLAFFTIIAAVYGYNLLLRLSKCLAIAIFTLLVLGLFAYAPNFTTALPENTPYFLDTFWPTWLLSVVSAGISGPIAFITLLGDYSRYISPTKHSSKNLLKGSFFGLILGILLPQLFGTYIAFSAHASTDFAASLVANCPAWYLFPLFATAALGSIGNAGVMLYSMGLDLDAIIPQLTRKWATILIAVLATALVFLGHFVWDAQAAMTSFVLMLTAIGTPWAVIVLINYFMCKGSYDKEALQIYNRSAKGGAYWFYAGWNINAAFAWAIGAVIGLAFVSTPLYEGPLAAFTGKIDLSFILSGFCTGITYIIIDKKFQIDNGSKLVSVQTSLRDE